MGSKNIFIIFLICVVLFFVLKIGPIVYRGTIGIRGVCSDQVDRYKKYGTQFVLMRTDEHLNQIGIPKGKSKHKLEIKDDKVFLEIEYWDTAVFYKDYKRDFKFNHRCESETHTYFK